MMKFTGHYLFLSFLTLILIPSHCFSEINDEFASLETDSMFIIDGKVNVISGEFIDVETDITIPSIFPLSVKRNSIVPIRSKHEKWVGWHLDLFSRFMYGGAESLPKTVSIREENGTGISFQIRSDQVGTFVSIEKPPKASTNLGRRLISGKTSLKNYELKIDNNENKIILKTGGGINKTFPKGNTKFYEKLENASGFCMTWGKSGPWEWIKRSFSKNNEMMGQLIFADSEQVRSSPRVCIYTSDDSSVIYDFGVPDKKEGYGLLDKVTSSSKPTIQYKYDKFSRCIKKILPDDRYIKIDYYSKGDTEILTDLSMKKSKAVLIDSDAINRVHYLSQPALNDNLHTTRKFIYSFTKNWKNEINGGKTDVYDAYNNQSTYSYNQDFRPTEIMHYQDGIAEIKHQLYWGAPNSHQEGCLTAKIVNFQRGNEFKAKSLEYDDRGNVEKEIFYGSLTGHSFNKPNFNETGSPTNHLSEGYEKKFSYSSDGLNNLIKETHHNGLQILYSYYDASDLLKHKEIFAKGYKQTIKYEYHACGALNRVVEDDGKVCLITKYVPKLSQPCFGYPETTQEFCKDSNSKERLLKTTHIKYHKLGKPEKIEVYDANGEFAYSEKYENFTKLGDCQKETKRTGEIILRKFDDNGNLLEERGPSDLYLKTFAYDKMNRLTSETIKLKDGSAYTTTYGYNALGALEFIIDPYGQQTTYINDRYNRPCQIIYPMVDGICPSEFKEYDIFGNVTLFRDCLGRETRTTFNAYDKPLSIQYPDGSSEHFEYNRDGTLKFSIDKNGLKTEFETDPLGRVTKKIIHDPKGLAVETYRYHNTLLVSSTNFNQVTTLYDYDGAGRLIGTSTAGSKTTFEYDSLGRLSRTSRYNQGQLISTSVEIFDVADRVKEKWVEDCQGNRFLYEEYCYDPLGNIESEKKGGQETTYLYDGLNRLIKKTDPEGHVTKWIYSRNGRVETRIDPNGVSTVQSYDALQRLTLEEKYDNKILFSSVSYSRDLVGNIIKESHQVIGSKTESYILLREYDEMNRLKKLTEPKGKVTEYTYTLMGQLKTVTKPDGIILTYEYDERGNLKSLYSSDRSINDSYDYDLMGNLLNVSGSNIQSGTYLYRSQ